MNGTLRALAIGIACCGLACASTHAVSPGATKVIKVAADGKVDKEEVHLSVAANDQVQWDTEAGMTLQVLPEEAAAAWPLNVTCNGNRCSGTLKPSPRLGRHPYRAQVDKTTGTDPVIIIDA